MRYNRLIRPDRASGWDQVHLKDLAFANKAICARYLTKSDQPKVSFVDALIRLDKQLYRLQLGSNNDKRHNCQGMDKF